MSEFLPFGDLLGAAALASALLPRRLACAWRDSIDSIARENAELADRVARRRGVWVPETDDPISFTGRERGRPSTG